MARCVYRRLRPVRNFAPANLGPDQTHTFGHPAHMRSQQSYHKRDFNAVLASRPVSTASRIFGLLSHQRCDHSLCWQEDFQGCKHD